MDTELHTKSTVSKFNLCNNNQWRSCLVCVLCILFHFLFAADLVSPGLENLGGAARADKGSVALVQSSGHIPVQA